MHSAPIHFDEDQRPTATVDAICPESAEVEALISEAREEGYAAGFQAGRGDTGATAVFQLCLHEAATAEEVGIRLCALAYVANFEHDSVASIRALAELWRLPVTTAYDQVKKIRTLLSR